MTSQLTELQQDALIEIFNVGMGQAANSMSQIVDEEIALSVPRLNILSGAERADRIREAIHSKNICAISQDFVGSINAKAFLIFPEGKTQEIVLRMIGESVSVDELNEMEQEALSEIGNIILNSCISSLCETLQTDFHCSLPSYHLGTTDEILFANSELANDLLMLFHVDFSMPKAKIDGYLVFLLNLPSFKTLIEQVDRFLLSITR